MRGDLAFALQSRTDRAIAQLNVQPTAATVINGTRFPPPINAAGVVGRRSVHADDAHLRG